MHTWSYVLVTIYGKSSNRENTHIQRYSKMCRLTAAAAQETRPYRSGQLRRGHGPPPGRPQPACSRLEPPGRAQPGQISSQRDRTHKGSALAPAPRPRRVAALPSAPRALCTRLRRCHTQRGPQRPPARACGTHCCPLRLPSGRQARRRGGDASTCASAANDTRSVTDHSGASTGKHICSRKVKSN